MTCLNVGVTAVLVDFSGNKIKTDKEGLGKNKWDSLFDSMLQWAVQKDPWTVLNQLELPL